jgi:3-oxoadipate CoA-transferase, beta subunit
MGPTPRDEAIDLDLINAGKQPISLLNGGSYFHHADSFAMMRGGHLDICVMGGMQVSAASDLSNWSLGRRGELAAVGGAMDLAVGARRVFIMMDHNSKDGVSKIVQTCTLPLTGAKVVDRIYTDLAVIDVTPSGLAVRDMIEGMTLEILQQRIDAPLRMAKDGERTAP